MLSSIRKKYDLKFFQKNDLIILKGLTTWNSMLFGYGHTPSIDSIKNEHNEINIVVDFGKQVRGEGNAPTMIWDKGTTHFIVVPKNSLKFHIFIHHLDKCLK